MAPASLGSLHARFSLEFPAPMSFCKPAVPAGWSILESCPRISTPSICLTDHFHHVYCLDETFLSDSPQSLHLLSECPALTLRKHTRDCVLWILWLAPSPMKLARKKKKKLFFMDYKVGMGGKCKLKMIKGKWKLTLFYHLKRKKRKSTSQSIEEVPSERLTHTNMSFELWFLCTNMTAIKCFLSF